MILLIPESTYEWSDNVRFGEFSIDRTIFCCAPLLKYVIPSKFCVWMIMTIMMIYKMMTIPIADSQSGSEHFSTFCSSPEVCGKFLRKRKQISIKGEETSVNKLPVVNFISVCGCILLTIWSSRNVTIQTRSHFIAGNNLTIIMRFLYVLSLAGLASAGVQTVKREAEPDAEADPQLLSGHKPIAVSAPECHSVPELKCAPRQVSAGMLETIV